LATGWVNELRSPAEATNLLFEIASKSSLELIYSPIERVTWELSLGVKEPERDANSFLYTAIILSTAVI
jgi:hypothetical protein